MHFQKVFQACPTHVPTIVREIVNTRKKKQSAITHGRKVAEAMEELKKKVRTRLTLCGNR